MSRLSTLLFLVFASSAFASSNLCPTFTAKNSTAKTYHVYYYNNGQYASPPPTLPANMTYSTPAKIADQTHPSDKFTITNCTSTTQSSCSHGGCYINYMTSAQITHGGLCMTASAPAATANATFSWKACTGAGSDTQIFALSQYVNYAPAYASIYSYGSVDVSLVEPGLNNPGGATGPFQAWYIGGNNRTIEAILYPYTQAGLSASLL